MIRLLAILALAGCTVTIDARVVADNGSTVRIEGNSIATDARFNPPEISYGLASAGP